MRKIPPDQLAPLIRAIGQRRIAAEIGVSQALISLWLSGRRTLADDKYDLLIECLRGHLDQWRSLLRRRR